MKWKLLLVLFTISANLIAQKPDSFFKLNLEGGFDDFIRSTHTPYTPKKLKGSYAGLSATKYWGDVGFTIGGWMEKSLSPSYDTTALLGQLTLPKFINFLDSGSPITNLSLGAGPAYKKSLFANKVLLEARAEGGINLTRGGIHYASIFTGLYTLDLLHDFGFRSKQVPIYSKLQLLANYRLNEKLALFLTGSYSHNFRQNQGSYFDRSQLSKNGFSYSLSNFQYGGGIAYILKRKEEKKKPDKEVFRDLNVTVLDKQTGLPLYLANVTVKDTKGNETTYQTDKTGAVRFPALLKGEYVVSGQLNGIQATQVSIYETDFGNPEIKVTLTHNDPRFTLLGFTINKNNGGREPGVLVSLENLENGQLETRFSKENNAEFLFQLGAGMSYKLYGKKNQYISNIENVSTLGLDRSTTLYVNLELGIEEARPEIPVKLSNIYYDYNSSDIRAAGSTDLERLVQFLKDNPSLTIELHSHTDSRGSSTFNLDLSQKRSASVRNFLISRGFSGERIRAVGHGENQLLNGCADGVPCTEEQRQVNRRTELRIIN